MKEKLLGVVTTWLVAGGLATAQDYAPYQAPSLYSDIKARSVGDVVTILVVEATSGARESNINSSSEAAVEASGSLSGNLTSFLPLFGASSQFGSQYDGNESTTQKDLLTGKITAVVTELLPNGNLVLQGKRRLEVNGETHILAVKGVVRPRDVTSGNTVFSYNLANVEIEYRRAGLTNSLGKPGWLSRWTSWLILAGLGAAAYLGVGAVGN